MSIVVCGVVSTVDLVILNGVDVTWVTLFTGCRGRYEAIGDGGGNEFLD